MVEFPNAFNWRRRPMVAIVLPFILGILVGDGRSHLLPFAVLLLLVSVIGSACDQRVQRFAVPCLLFCLGWLAVHVSQSVLSPYDIRRLTTEQPELLEVRGTVDEPPATRLRVDDGQETWRTSFVIRVEACKRKTGWEPLAGLVLVACPGDLSGEIHVGQGIEVTGVLRPPASAIAEGLFDHRKHLSRKGIYRELETQSPSDLTLENSSHPIAQLRESFQTWARRTLSRGLEEDQPVRLLWAMTLGWRAALTDEVAEPFMRSGTMHIFAISGLHVTLIAAVLVNLLRLLRLPRGWCGLVVIPLLWLYSGATGWQPSAVRSTIMATVVIAGWSLHRPGDLVNSLAAAAFIILVWDPQQLFLASFQLSFAVVFSIALILPHIERVRARLIQPDPFLPPELRPRWQRWLDWPVRFVTMNFATSLAAWLGSLPLVATYFHLLTPVSLLANLIIVPLAGLALMSCCGSLLFGTWFSWLSECFNHSAWFWMWLMQHASNWFANLPGAWLPVREPSLAGYILYYTVLGAVVTGVAFHRAAWKWLGPLVAVPVILLVVQAWAERGSMRMDVLACRGGEAILVDVPGGASDLLIDCAVASDAGGVVVPFVRSRGMAKVPTVVLTHGDHRHASGFEVVDDGIRPQRVITSSLAFRSPVYRQIVSKLDSDGRRTKRNRGDSFLGWEVLHPHKDDKFSQADDGALVLKTQFQRMRLLLISDLGSAGQDLLLQRETDLKADIVIAGTPAQGEPLREAFLAAIHPQCVIITASEYPAGERPSDALRSRLAAWKSPVIYTLDEGSVTLKFTSEGCEVRTVAGTKLTLRPRKN